MTPTAVESKSTKPAVKSEPVTTVAPPQPAKAATNGAAAAKPPVKTGSRSVVMKAYFSVAFLLPAAKRQGKKCRSKRIKKGTYGF